MEIKNAKITDTMLGLEDHGIMTFSIYLSYDSFSQSAGGICLCSSKPTKDKSAIGIALIRDIIMTVGVEKWEDLKGKHVRARCDNKGVYAIGNIVEYKWTCFDEFINKFK